jgi:NADPH:quinone reductase-like Zn-dependent oxidoreductase
MRSYHLNLGAGIDGLSVREHDTPEPVLNEVLVHVRARSLSFRELMVLRGWYPLPVKPDVIPISDGAGDVVAVGEHVSRVAVGDRVTASMFPRWIDGPFAEAFGGRVIATTSSEAKAARLRTLGADEVIDSRATPACHERVRALTGGRGVDHVIEVTGMFPGCCSPPTAPDRRRQPCAVPGDEPRDEANRLTPVIDRVFPFDEAVEAYRYYQAEQPLGKVVIAHP